VTDPTTESSAQSIRPATGKSRLAQLSFGGTRVEGVTAVPRHTVENLDAKDELFSVFPPGKVEVEGSVIITPALKAKIAGGLNLPGYGVRAGLVYLIGAR
jgi:hypothetical protein